MGERSRGRGEVPKAVRKAGTLPTGKGNEKWFVGQGKEPARPKREVHPRESDAEIQAWLTDYYERVQTGARKEGANLKYIESYADGPVVSDNIVYEVEDLLSPDSSRHFRREEYSRSKRPFNTKTLTEELDCSRREAVDVVAFTVLFRAKYDLGLVMEYYEKGDTSFLNSLGVSDTDAQKIVDIFKDKKRITELLEILFLRTGKLLEKNMTGRAALEFVDRVRLFLPDFQADYLRKYLATPHQKEECRRGIMARKKDHIGLALALFRQGYEYLFGEATAEEFLLLFPDWYQAESIYYDTFRRRYNLSIPGEQPGPGPRQAVALAEKAPVRAEGRNVRIVEEEQLLRLRAGSGAEEEIPDYILPYTTPRRTLPTGGLAVTRETGLEPAEAQEPEMTVFVPLDRSESNYLDVIEPAVERMRAATETKERLNIFLADVWTQFLIARADEAVTPAIEGQVRAAIQLFDVRGDRSEFAQLVTLSADVEKNAHWIEEVAKMLRQNRTLHEEGVYVRTDILRRRRNTPEGELVHLLSSQCFEVAGGRRYEVDGTPTFILFLDRRIDRLDESVQALGYRYIGDQDGVVLMEPIRRAANHGILPRLRTDARYLVTAEDRDRIHPVNGLIDQALRRDYGTNPTPYSRELIYRSRYQSTAAHELQHGADEIRGVQAGWPQSVARRVAQEVTAYLASIADDPKGFTEPSGDMAPRGIEISSSRTRRNAPFVDLVSVIQTFLSYEDPLVRLNDLPGIYKRMGERVLQLFAEKLRVSDIRADDFETRPLDACAAVLREALTRTSEELQRLAQEILEEEIARQSQTGRAAHRAAEHNSVNIVFGAPDQREEITTTNTRPRALAAGRTDASIDSAEQVRAQLSAGSMRGRLRGAMYAVALLAALGVRGDSVESMVVPAALRPSIEKPVEPGKEGESPDSHEKDTSAEQKEEEKADGNGWEKASPAELQSFHRGVWGYAEYMLHTVGFSRQVAAKAAKERYPGNQAEIQAATERIYRAVVQDTANKFVIALERQSDNGVDVGLYYGESDKVDVEKWSRRITPARARKVSTTIRTLFSPTDILVIVGGWI